MTIRPIRWPQEIGVLRLLNTSFSTSHLFQVQCDGQTFTLIEGLANPPIQKSYSLSDLSDDLLLSDYTVLAEEAGEVAGFASMRFVLWNKRSILRHLYVAPKYRKRGVGRALVETIFLRSTAMGGRCLWVETQNINYPAIQFYLRLGFRLCGLDTSLYDLPDDSIEEIGLFFAKF